MTEQIFHNPDIYRIDVPLPNNPLKNLNCYVIKTPQRNLIIDTGFNMPECLQAMREGLSELQVDLNRTDLFLTHLHSDHTGLAAILMPPSSIIYMSRIDYAFFTSSLTGSFWKERDTAFTEEGFPVESLRNLQHTNPARSYAPAGMFPAKTFDDGFEFQLGKYLFRCILTPGHTPGHACLYLPEQELMFLGDHVLFDITPNITSWPRRDDSLADYIRSLHKIQKIPMKTALPAHRGNGNVNVYDRIDQIIAHHKRRLQNTLDIVKEHPGENAYEIGSHMTWKMRGKNWEDFPIQQKWFAVGETIAHLDYLRNRGLIRKEIIDGKTHYYANSQEIQECF